MKITVSKDKLLEAMQKVVSLVGSRTTLPILANVMLEADDNQLTLTSTDLEVRISARVAAVVDTPGRTTMPAKKLLSQVSRFRAAEVAITVADNHHASITCGTYSGTMYGLPTDDFPTPVECVPSRRLSIPSADLARILDQISYAVSLDDSRKVLHGVLVSIKDGSLTCVATDGKRLALVERIIEGIEGDDGDAILPLKSANELRRLLGKSGAVSIEVGDSQMVFKTDDSVLTTKRIEGSYPNYRQIIPPSFSKTISIPVDEFTAALDLVSTTITDSTSFVRLTFADNQVRFEASSAEVGAASDHIPIEYSDHEMAVSFNPHFLADPFRKLGADKANFKANDGSSPVVVEGGDGFLYVIMPMRGRQ